MKNLPKPTILIVDDEPSMIEILDYNLRKEGYDVVAARDGKEALRLFAEKTISLVILDVMMPGLDGMDVCREMRKTSAVPIIMLTAKASETSKVVGLELGADDYVTKPFSIAELMARVKAVLRRTTRPDAAPGETGEAVRHGDLVVDRTKRECSVAGRTVELTSKEFDIMFLLASNPGVVFTRERMLDKLWGGEAFVVDRAIDVHIRHLRQKVEESGAKRDYITTVRGVGYKFESS